MIFILFFLDILAINTRDGNKRAYSINLSGGYEQLDFDFGYGTDVEKSCSLQWQNQYYVFGGHNEKRQVSMVNGNRLERKATLDFNLNAGGCTAGVGKPTENGKTEKTFSQFSGEKRKENVCSDTVGKTEKTENGF